jgi:hypothetical protein
MLPNLFFAPHLAIFGSIALAIKMGSSDAYNVSVRRDTSPSISFDAVIERLAPEVPRFIVYPGQAWDETETFVVDVWLNGTPVGLRNLIPWKGRGWHFGLSEPMCRMAKVETGDAVYVEMRRVRDPRPPELVALMKNNAKASAVWEAMAPSQRRDFALWVAGAKQSETRARRAKRLI